MIIPKHLITSQRLFKKIPLGIFQIFRKCSDLSIVKTQLEVPTFCDIHIDLGCKVRVRPLNVHKYHNANAFLLQTDQKYDNAIEHYLDGNKVIVTSQKGLNPNTLCSIKAPVKANLHIKAKNDVTVGYFQGDKININTESNVFVDKFQGDTIDVTTSNGNVVFHNFIEAANISAVVSNGSISTGKLQGLNLKLKVSGEGSISVDSSYCEESIFVVEKGDMDLSNIHRNCKIFLMKGNLSLNSFDGQLSALLNSGSADVHLSRIHGNSDITLKDSGDLILKLAESCQDFTTFRITSPNVSFPDAVKSEINKNENLVVLRPEASDDNTVLVNCSNANVKVESTSWQEMMQMKLKNK
ncbi:unnamed protein product [Ceutorhynchus assimilis]|uniref:DUF4097 domain-containing protein n=1 Tax=Ceutorhynchus assimilis TaxID=467358 RepID=A0A9N9MSF4_9CUCU|nr:unnamed protein product [Ceutorhynchus assimilis]